MISRTMTYETLTHFTDYEQGLGVTYNYRNGEYSGTVSFTEYGLSLSLHTGHYIYIIEIDITPDSSPDIANYWACEFVKAYAKVKKSHAKMTMVMLEMHVSSLTKSLYRGNNRTRKIVEFFNVR